MAVNDTFRREQALAASASEEHSNPSIVSDNGRAPKILIVCTLYTLAYRTLRCASATGAEVFVLGSANSRGMRYSRHCKKFFESPVPFNGEPTDDALAEINRAVQALDIDVVLAGDAPSTRTVVGLKRRINAVCFPCPNLEAFDILNDKWAFSQLCEELEILQPQSQLFATKEEMLQEIERGSLKLPALAKPLSLDGGHGIVRLEGEDGLQQAHIINYAPILGQEFIEGEDIGASVYCEAGEVRAFILHRLKRATYSTFDDPNVYADLSRIAQKMALSGIFNFDMRLSPEGKVYFLECNPRVFYKMNLSMLAGINFVLWGLDARRAKSNTRAPARTAVLAPRALALAALTPWRLRRADFAMIDYLLSDPVPYLRELFRLEWEP